MPAGRPAARIWRPQNQIVLKSKSSRNANRPQNEIVLKLKSSLKPNRHSGILNSPHVAAYAHQEATMSPDELRESIKILGWSQFDAALNLGIAPRLFRYWCAGDPRHPMPPVVGFGIRWLVRERANTSAEQWDKIMSLMRRE